MSNRLSRLPLRLRLVAGFSAAMLIVLTAAGAFVYWRVQYALDRGLDTELAQAAGTIEPLVARDGTVADTTAADATGAAWQTLAQDGKAIAHGGAAGATALVGSDALGDLSPDSTPVTVDVGTLLPAADRPYRMLVSPVAGAADPVYLLVAVRRDHRDEALRELLLQLSLAGLGALALTALVGDRLAWFALLPVERYRQRAEEIAGGATGLTLDVPRGRDDEVTRLGHTLNDMLAELERSLERERRFVDEASHELRTPLTLLSSRIQLARRRSRTLDEHERVLDELAIDVARLTALAEELLALGAAHGATPGRSDAGAVAAEVVRRHYLARPERADEITVLVGSDPIAVAMDASALDRVVGNLIDNAVKYGAAPVDVAVDVVTADRGTISWGRVMVADAGPGMSADLLAAATQRFSRAAQSRSAAGAGLGLSLVEALVSSAQGELRLCHAGHHQHHGAASGVRCDHDSRMTVTVLLPLAGAGP